jgi:exodeoxyribonuclease VII large subunit
VAAVVAAADRRLRDATGEMWVRGEVSAWKRYPSGHRYFTLKDAKAQIACVMFAQQAGALPAEPADGDEVLVYGQIGVHQPRGQLQIVASRLEGTGIGGLWAKARDEVTRALRAEGLLDEARKRPLPRLPERVGVVTSAQGAALADMNRALRRRAWWVTMVVSPCPVEGVAAAPEIAHAIRRFGPGRCEVDVVLVARGGGSPESLWAFNTEEVARAIAACPYPVVSAVGHETDHTLADAVADRRAATPTAGAEIVVPDGAAIVDLVRAYPAEIAAPLRRRAAADGALLARGRAALRQAMLGRVRLGQARASAAAAALEARSPRRTLAAREAELARLREEMAAAVRRRMDGLRLALGAAAAGLESRSPLHVLARGYALLTDAETGRAVRAAAETRPGQRVRARLAEGEIALVVDHPPIPAPE